MINVNELMLGNWIIMDKLVHKNQRVRVKSIVLSNDRHGNKVNGYYSTDKIRAVPLSPEILEKCGFVKFKDSDTEYALCYDNHVGLERFIGYSLHDQILTLDHYYNGHNKELYFTHIEYLHQLQNLYYSLTHTPLKIQL